MKHVTSFVRLWQHIISAEVEGFGPHFFAGMTVCEDQARRGNQPVHDSEKVRPLNSPGRPIWGNDYSGVAKAQVRGCLIHAVHDLDVPS
jgi:hypothetical protein